MKLCLILGGNEVGGLENHFFELANTIENYLPEKESHEIIVLANKCYKKRINSKVTFHAIDLSRSRRNPYLMYQIVKLLRKYAPDVIHAHANKASALINNIRFFIKCKCVATIHSQKKNISMYEKFDHVIGVSHSVIANIQSSRKSVIYNGVSDDFVNNKFTKITRSDLAIQNNLPILVSIGRLVKVKALDVLFSSIKNIPCNLLVIGEGPEQKTLQLQVKLDKHRNIHFLGFQKNIKSYLELADLTVISSYREGFSYVVAESLLMNTPVVSTDVPVANEILPESCIADVGEPASLTRVILHALTNGEDYEKYFNFAKLHFTTVEMNKKIASVYSQVLSQKNNRSHDVSSRSL